ncbi:putative flavin-containing polyamine oxidase [Ilyonectria robusta]|uniref:putative flavin-containing polyamine oxidase n=1 Tax=Ilyonectria robusta TaxID=1079257 RepID=UPI001E8DB18C|nr:putative flavin-containing polyamine oxidase [Ilyonectria robusta]KAH8686438.1 putative flavin-containing polyamine oxidase [Ilyonectria robusta]
MKLSSKPLVVGACSVLLTTSDAAALPRSASGKTCRKTKVAVLGAGVAGITAAQALSNSSISDFIIVERNDYVGGRVKHTSFGSKPDGSPYLVELGANWIQGLGSPGGPENPIWTLGKKYGIKNTYSNYDSISTFDENGYNDYTDILDDFSTKYDVAAEIAGNALLENLQDTSMRAGLSAADWKPKKNMLAQAVEWWNWDWETSYPPQQSGFQFGITGYNLTFYQFSDENNFVTDQRGFNRFVIGEANQYLKKNDRRLLLNTTVKSIAYTDEGVTVHMDDDECIKAEYAICTFSVGVLQNEAVKFSPALPGWKTDAIEQFQMGTYTKIFMQFNETFWGTDKQYFLYADPTTRGYYPVWQSLDTKGFIEGSHIIFATVVDSEAHRIEQQSDEETKAEMMKVLKSMFPDKDIPEPTAFMYPRWSEEEMSFGSYSNWPVGMTLEKHQNLRANVDRLWFAGEANSAQYYGFLHGAWFEGREVGLRIAGLLGANLRGNVPTGEMRRYEVLHGTSEYGEYDSVNGWAASSFLTWGVEG